MKYKELPAFETNEFEVGNAIKVYVGKNIYEVIVRGVNGDLVILEVAVDGFTHVHFKQCRKLVEVRPREFWIDKGYKEIPYVGVRRDKDIPDDNVQIFRPMIKVREVLEDDHE